jgi:hypothetical protein
MLEVEHGGMRRRPEPGGGDHSDVLAGTTLHFDAIIRPEVLEFRGLKLGLLWRLSALI